jgi:lysyl-tRNA synthetase class 2
MTDDSPSDLAGAAAEERAARIAKVARLRERGDDPYPVRFDRDATAASIREAHGDLPAGTETGVPVRVAGRLLLIRRQGKLIFASMRDGSRASTTSTSVTGSVWPAP